MKILCKRAFARRVWGRRGADCAMEATKPAISTLSTSSLWSSRWSFVSFSLAIHNKCTNKT